MNSSKKVNEDNWTGFHSGHVTNGINEAPVYDADLPVSVDILKGTGAPGGYVSARPGYNTFNWNWEINFFSKNVRNTEISKTATAASGGGGGAVSQGLAWFGTHFNEIAIVGATIGALAGLIALIKAANRQIKVRYNKVVKALQKAQKEFTTSPDGLDMKAVLPGFGGLLAKMGDVAARIFTGNFGKSEGDSNNNIGLYPFCNKYKEEIAKDYKVALDSYNKVITAYNTQEKSGENAEGEAQQENSSVQTKVYNSFREAYLSDHINENLSENKLNESILASMGISLAAMGVSKLGQFVFSKIGKNGKPEEGSEKKVQVTKESIREVCYAIMFNYMDKYVNMDKVFKQLGIDSKSLSDLDKSSCEKLKGLLKKYEKPEKNDYTKQYGRIKSAYDNMLSHYYKIGDGIIKNFEKYTKADDEKHANLLVSAKEKLQGMWDAQKDIYDNNFSHVLIEIVSCDAYVGYLNFIIENVIPIFETGTAGDADYILDVAPRKDQFYVVRQTEGQPWLEENEKQKGNVAVVKVLSFDDKTKEIELSMVGLLKSDYTVTDGTAVIPDDANIDYDAYKNDNGESKTVKIAYGKFLSMDPAITTWNGKSYSEPYFRVIKDQEDSDEETKSNEEFADYIYAYGGIEKDGYEYIAYALYDGSKKDYVKKKLFKLSSPISKDEFKSFVEKTSDNKEENMGFKELPKDKASGYIQILESVKKDEVDAGGTAEVAKAINDRSDKEETRPSIEKATPVYKRSMTIAKLNLEVDEYIFAQLSKDVESVLVDKNTMRLNDHVNEADDESIDSIEVVKPEDVDAEKTLVTKIYYSYIEKGTDVSGKVDDVKSSHAIITVDPCSVKDFVASIEGLDPKFEVVAGDEKPARKFIIDGITSNSEIKEKYQIGNIAEALKFVEERKSYLDDESGKINVENIVSEIENKIKQMPTEYKSYGLRKMMKKSDNSPIDAKYPELVGVLTDVVDQNGCFSIKSGIQSDGKDLMIDVYPVATLTVGKDNKDHQRGGIIISFGENKQTVSNWFDKKGIADAIQNLVKADKEKQKIEDPGFSSVTGIADKFKQKAPQQQNSSDDGNIPQEIKASYDKAFENVNIENGNFVLSDGANDKYADDNVRIIFPEGGKGNSLKIAFKENDEKNIWITATCTLSKDDSMIVSSSVDNKKNQKVDPKNASAVRNAVFFVNGKVPAEKQSAENNKQNQQNQQANQQQNQQNKQVNQQNKQMQPQQNGSAQQQRNNAPQQQPQQTGTNMVNNMDKEANKNSEITGESTHVSYSVDNVIHESLGSKIVVTRSFEDYIPKWYVLSESVYDDGNGRSTKLDSPSIRRRMLTRSDVMKFVKDNDNARIMESAYDHTYEISDHRGYTPSVSTPLYESVMLVKFDNEGNITGKHYIGKNRIQ